MDLLNLLNLSPFFPKEFINKCQPLKNHQIIHYISCEDYTDAKKNHKLRPTKYIKKAQINKIYGYTQLKEKPGIEFDNL